MNAPCLLEGAGAGGEQDSKLPVIGNHHHTDTPERVPLDSEV
jgi:hypothetical protein